MGTEAAKLTLKSTSTEAKESRSSKADTGDEDEGGAKVGIIVGVVIAVLVVGGVIAALVLLKIRKKNDASVNPASYDDGDTAGGPKSRSKKYKADSSTEHFS